MVRAKRLIICPPMQLFKGQKIHPSECHSHAYSDDMRDCAVQNQLNVTDQDTATLQLQVDKKYPSTSTIDRWMAR